MIRNLLVLFSFIFLQLNVKSQLTYHSFKLNGIINIDTGTIRLIPIADNKYYPHGEDYYQTKIIKGTFLFKDTTLYPYAFRLMAFTNDKRIYISGFFIVDPGIQNISCNINSRGEMPRLVNKSMTELAGSYSNAFKSYEIQYDNFGKKEDSINNKYNNNVPDSIKASINAAFDEIIHEKDELLLQYTVSNPNSFVALWKLIYRLSSGYNPIFDTIFTRFSPGIKSTHIGKVLALRLKNARVLSIGSIFPQLILSDTNNKKSISTTLLTKKYILIDFWFSHCNPCISQFNKLKEIFDTYHAEDFDIIGISVDIKKDTRNWKEVIQEYRLPWNQYLDINGKQSIELSIDAFPTNFLVNEKGEIIKINVSPEELEIFLSKNKINNRTTKKNTYWFKQRRNTSD